MKNFKIKNKDNKSLMEEEITSGTKWGVGKRVENINKQNNEMLTYRIFFFLALKYFIFILKQDLKFVNT